MNETKNTIPATIDKQPPGVMLYATLYEPFKVLSHEQVGLLIMALLEYLLYGAEPVLDGSLAFAWSFLKNYADVDRKRYTEAVLRRRNAADKRWQREKKAAPAANSDHGAAEWMKKYM